MVLTLMSRLCKVRFPAVEMTSNRPVYRYESGECAATALRKFGRGSPLNCTSGWEARGIPQFRAVGLLLVVSFDTRNQRAGERPAFNQ